MIMSIKQRKVKIEPRIKLNQNKYPKRGRLTDSGTNEKVSFSVCFIFVRFHYLWTAGKDYDHLRLCSHLVPENGARLQFSLGD